MIKCSCIWRNTEWTLTFKLHNLPCLLNLVDSSYALLDAAKLNSETVTILQTAYILYANHSSLQIINSWWSTSYPKKNIHAANSQILVSHILLDASICPTVCMHIYVIF
jgi:hypothetical protein